MHETKLRPVAPAVAPAAAQAAAQAVAPAVAQAAAPAPWAIGAKVRLFFDNEDVEGHGEEAEVVEDDEPEEEWPGRWYIVKLDATQAELRVHEDEMRPV